MQRKIFRLIAIILILCMSSPVMPNMVIEQSIRIENMGFNQVMNGTTTSGVMGFSVKSTITTTNSTIEGIYINGGAENNTLGIGAGNDGANGLSPTTPVKTVKRAKELVQEVNESMGETLNIIVCGSIILHGQEETWSLPEGSQLIRYNGYSGVMIEVKNNGKLTLENITINGNNNEAKEAAVKVINSTLIMGEDARIINNNNTNDTQNTSADGGGLYLKEANFTMMGNAEISGNEATRGGGIFQYKGTTIMQDDSIVDSNKSRKMGGGLYLDYANFTMLDNAEISGNEASDGGGIYQYGSKMLMQGDSIVDSNTAQETGGGIRQNQSIVTVEGCAGISNNKAGYYGGGVFAGSDGNTFILKGEAPHIDNNYATKIGGGIFVGYEGILQIDGGVIANNRTIGTGGGICSRGANVIKGSTTITQNYAKHGGGVFFESNSDSHIGEKVVITYNVAEEIAGGVGQNVGSKLVIDGEVIISHNTAYRAGGLYIKEDSAEHAPAECIVEGKVIISDNTTKGAGGGIWQTGGNLKIQGDVQITNNKAGTSGGGISLKYGNLTIADKVQVEKNEAVNGGGFYLESGHMSMEGGQIKGNKAEKDGGGIYVHQNITDYPLLIEGDISDNEDQHNSQVSVGKGSSIGLGKGGLTIAGIIYLDENATVKVAKEMTERNALYQLQCADKKNGRIVIVPEGQVVSVAYYLDYFKLVNNQPFIVRKEGKNIIMVDRNTLPDQVCFVDELNGSDGNSGTTSNEAFKTLSKAYKYLQDTGGTIFVMNSIDLSDEVSLSKDRYSDSKAAEIKVDGEVTIVGIGSEVEKGSLYLFKVADQSQLILQDIEIKLAQQDLGLIQISTGGKVIVKNNANLIYKIVDQNLSAIYNEGIIQVEGGKLNNTEIAEQVKAIYQKGNFILDTDQGVDLGSDMVYLTKGHTIEINKLWKGQPIRIAFENPEVGDEVAIFAKGAIPSSETVGEQVKHFNISEDILLVQGESPNYEQILIIGGNPKIQEGPKDYFGRIGETAEFVVKYSEAIPIEKMIVTLKNKYGQSVDYADITSSSEDNSITIKMDITEETIGTYRLETKCISTTEITSFTLSGYEVTYANVNDKLIARASRSHRPHEDYAILKVKSGYEDDVNLTLMGHSLNGITTAYTPQLVDEFNSLNLSNKDHFALQIDGTESIQADDKWTITLRNSQHLTYEAQGEIILEGLQLNTFHRSSQATVRIPFETKKITGAIVKINKDNRWLEQDYITLINQNIGQEYRLKKDSVAEVYYSEDIPTGEYTIYRKGISTGQMIKITDGNLEKVTLDYYTLTLIHNDGTEQSTIKEVLNGMVYADVLVPMERAGYYFSGYYTAAEGGQLYEEKIVHLTKAQILYAQWIKKVEDMENSPLPETDKPSLDEDTINSSVEILKEESISGAPYGSFIKKQVPYYLRNEERIIIGFSALINQEMQYIAPAHAQIDFIDNQKYFSDIATHWGKEAIDFITTREVFLGVTKEQFEPDSRMTRGMVVTALGRLYEKSYGPITVEYDKSFQDINETAYYAKYISWAKQNNIVEGRTSQLFAPDDYITREEFSKIIYRCSIQLDQDISANKEGLMTMKDQDMISNWALESMTYCIENELIIGNNNQLRPRGFITRAESAQILKRYIEMVVRQEVNNMIDTSRS